MKNNIINWKPAAIKLSATGCISWRQIAKTLKVPKSTVSDYLRDFYNTKCGTQIEYPILNYYKSPLGAWIKSEDPLCLSESCNSGEIIRPIINNKPKENINQRILIISDAHMPFEHRNTFNFLQELKDKYKPTRVVCIGDLEDQHSLSFHDSDPDLMSAGDELKKLISKVAILHDMFPEMDILDSNHGSLVYRKAKHHGIPRHYLKSYQDILQVGSGWKWHYDLTLTLPNGKPVYFHHGKSANGLLLSQRMGMRTVQGHHHNEFAIRYWSNPQDLLWSLQVGSLIDDDSYAFAYNNVNIVRPIIGTGLIIDSEPVLEPMKL